MARPLTPVPNDLPSIAVLVSGSYSDFEAQASYLLDNIQAVNHHIDVFFLSWGREYSELSFSN